MPDQLQLRGGTTTEHNSFTGVAREVTVDTTKKTLVVHDGASAGGTPLMKESGGNAASSVGIGTGGTNVINIDSSQKVGIGVGSPRALLDLGTGTDASTVSNTAANYQLGLHAAQSTGGDIGRNIAFISNSAGTVTAAINSVDEGGSDQTGLAFLTGNASSIAERFRIDQNGSCGIGTTSPTRRLEVHDSDATVLALHSTSSHGTALRIFNNASEKMLIGSAGEFIVGQTNNVTDSAVRANGSLFFATGGGNQRMVIDSSGNCGIGTTDPDQLFHVSSTSATSTRISGDRGNVNGVNIANIEFENTFNSQGVIAEIRAITGDSGTQSSKGQLAFYTDDGSALAERIRLNSDGKFFINTATALQDANSTKAALHIKGGGGGPYPVVIKCTDSSGGAAMIQFLDGAGDDCGDIFSNGTNNTTSYNTSSDYRRKENTVNLSDGISRIKQLKPYRFNFISNPDKTKIDGFYAHEVSDVVPEAITGIKDEVDSEGNPKYQKIDHSKLVPLLVAAVQELIGKVEALEAA